MSFATVIGGAIAASVLDFSRHMDNRGQIRQFNKLNMVEGMFAVLARVSQGVIDNGYHCMAPWKTLPAEIKHCEQRQRRVRGRVHIRETISRALEDMH